MRREREDDGAVLLTPQEAERYAQSVGQYKGRQLSGVENGLARPTMDEDTVANPYMLDEVTVKAPDLRVAQMAAHRPDYWGLNALAGAAGGGIYGLAGLAGSLAFDKYIQETQGDGSFGEWLARKTETQDSDVLGIPVANLYQMANPGALIFAMPRPGSMVSPGPMARSVPTQKRLLWGRNPAEFEPQINALTEPRLKWEANRQAILEGPEGHLSPRERMGVPRHDATNNNKMPLPRSYKYTDYWVTPSEGQVFSAKELSAGDLMFAEPPRAGNPRNMELTNSIRDYVGKVTPDASLVSRFNDPQMTNLYRQYLFNRGYQQPALGRLTDSEIATLLADNYQQLSNNMTGKFKGHVLYNSSPARKFLNGDFDYVPPVEDNFGPYLDKIPYRQSKNVFFSDEPVFNQTRYYSNGADNPVRFLSRDQVPVTKSNFLSDDSFAVHTGDTQPYLLNNIEHVLQHDQNIPYGMKLNSNAITVDPTNRLNQTYMIGGDSPNVKSLFPHPDLFLDGGNGQRNWLDTRHNYARGGRLKR